MKESAEVRPERFDRPAGTGPDDQRFFYLHLLKTGGTSLFLRLPRVFGQGGVYPNNSDGDPVSVAPQLLVDQLLARWNARREEIRIVAGHFPLCTTELLGEPFRVVTVLREPVARTLSYLRHHRETTPDDRDLSLAQCYSDDFRFEALIHNHMVKMLALSTDEMTAGALTKIELGRHHLDRAKENLEAIEVVGLQERFGEFWQDLQLDLGWDLNDMAHVNQTTTVEVPSGLTDRITEDNALDVELYDFAVSLVDQRRQQRATRPAS